MFAWQRSRHVLNCGLVLVGVLLGEPARADSPALWLAPTLGAAGTGSDFRRFFDEPHSWAKASSKIDSFALPVNYLLRTSPATVGQDLAWLRGHHIKLSVSVPILPVDKKQCGFSIEGMIWPGEAGVMASRLSAQGIMVDSFTLDLPLSKGHFSKEGGACHLTIKDTAQKLAQSVRQLRQYYPHALIIDTEVPTGMPLGEWTAALTEWLTDYKEASGEDFDGVILDVWWPFPWQDVARETVRILQSRHIRSGIILDADGGNTTPAATWIAAAQRNACALRGFRFDIVGIANWLDTQVHNLPETDPNTLTALLTWFASGGNCLR